MTIEALRKVLPVPKPPVDAEAPAGGWAAVETWLGVALPDDFKAYLAAYGTGKVGGFLHVANPFSKTNPYFAFLSRTLGGEYAERTTRVASFAPYPERDGILPWGVTDNGHVLFWVTEGSPADWIVYASQPREGTDDLYAGSMTDFLTALVSGELGSKLFGDVDATFEVLS